MLSHIMITYRHIIYEQTITEKGQARNVWSFLHKFWHFNINNFEFFYVLTKCHADSSKHIIFHQALVHENGFN